MIDPQYPTPDTDRQERIISDVIGLLKIRDDEKNRKQVARWLHHTLVKAQKSSRLPWWFTRRVFSFVVYEGQDVFDLKKGIDAIISLHGEYKLLKKPLDTIMGYRSKAFASNSASRGEPRIYAEYGGRLHVWPAPHKTMMLHLCFTVPMTASIVPDEWETFLVDGVIGLYAAHFDKSGMLGEPGEFANRFWAGLKDSRSNNHDIEMIERGAYYAASMTGDNLSTAMAQVNSGNYIDNPETIVTPAAQGVPGNIQILGDNPTDNTHGTAVAQIPGDEQP